MRSRKNAARGQRSAPNTQETSAPNPWPLYRPIVQDELNAVKRLVGTLESLIEQLASSGNPSISPGDVLTEAHALRHRTSSVFWNIHDAERWHGSPMCGRVVPTDRQGVSGPCWREAGHDGTHVSVIRGETDEAIESVRILANSARRLDYDIAILTLSVKRRLVDQIPVDAVARDVLDRLPDRLITIAQGALDLVKQLSPDGDLYRVTWTPAPALAPQSRRTRDKPRPGAVDQAEARR